MGDSEIKIQLKEMLETAEKERREAVAPYDARIKQLKNAIRSVDQFEQRSVEINTRPNAKVASFMEGEDE